MKKWDYIVLNGPKLRDYIRDENHEKICTSLIQCIDELIENEVVRENDSEIENLLKDTKSCLNNINHFEELALTDKEIEQTLNTILEHFYEYCDKNCIWAGI